MVEEVRIDEQKDKIEDNLKGNEEQKQANTRGEFI